jgi:hypothetical protein
MNTVPRTLQFFNLSGLPATDNPYPWLTPIISSCSFKTKQGHEVCLCHFNDIDNNNILASIDRLPVLSFTNLKSQDIFKDLNDTDINIYIQIDQINYSFSMPKIYIQKQIIPCILIKNNGLSKLGNKNYIKYNIKIKNETYFVYHNRIEFNGNILIVPIMIKSKLFISDNNIKQLKYDKKTFYYNQKIDEKNNINQAKYLKITIYYSRVKIKNYIIPTIFLVYYFKYPIQIYLEAAYLYLTDIVHGYRPVAKLIQKKYGIAFSYATLCRFIHFLDKQYKIKLFNSNHFMKNKTKDYLKLKDNYFSHNFIFKKYVAKCKYFYLTYYILLINICTIKISKYSKLYRKEVQNLKSLYIQFFSEFLLRCNNDP